MLQRCAGHRLRAHSKKLTPSSSVIVCRSWLQTIHGLAGSCSVRVYLNSGMGEHMFRSRQASPRALGPTAPTGTGVAGTVGALRSLARGREDSSGRSGDVPHASAGEPCGTCGAEASEASTAWGWRRRMGASLSATQTGQEANRGGSWERGGLGAGLGRQEPRRRSSRTPPPVGGCLRVLSER